MIVRPKHRHKLCFGLFYALEIRFGFQVQKNRNDALDWTARYGSVSRGV